jgi:hypothetical protein
LVSVYDRSDKRVGGFAGFSGTSVLVVEDWNGIKVVALRDTASGAWLSSRDTNLSFISSDCSGTAYTDMSSSYAPMQGWNNKKYIAVGPATTLSVNSWYSWRSPPYGCITAPWTGPHWRLVEVVEPEPVIAPLSLRPN